MSGPIPARVDGAAKAALLGLIDDAVRAGWSLTRACAALELAAGAPSRRGPAAGPSRDYHNKPLRDAEKAIVEQQEHAYEVLVAHWQPQRPHTTT